MFATRTPFPLILTSILRLQDYLYRDHSYEGVSLSAQKERIQESLHLYRLQNDEFRTKGASMPWYDQNIRFLGVMHPED